jgi:hypothetical protein
VKTAVIALWLAQVAPPAAPSPANPPAAPAAWAQLEWHLGRDADACITRDELARDTEALLRRVVFSGEGVAALKIHGAIGRDARGRWSATLSLATTDGRPLGTRELTSDAADCRALDESLSVVLSLMVDVARTRPELAAPQADAGEPPRAPAAAPAPATVAAGEAMEAPAAGWGWDVAVGGVLGPGLLPGLAVGAQAALGWRSPGLPPFELRGLWWSPSSEQHGAYGSEVWGWELGLAVCAPGRGSARFEIGGCAGAEAGQYRARGLGLDSTGSTAGPLAEAVLGPRLRVRLGGGWEARLGLEAVLALVRTRLVASVNGASELLFHSAVISPRVGLEVAWTAP